MAKKANPSPRPHSTENGEEVESFPFGRNIESSPPANGEAGPTSAPSDRLSPASLADSTTGDNESETPPSDRLPPTGPAGGEAGGNESETPSSSRSLIPGIDLDSVALEEDYQEG